MARRLTAVLFAACVLLLGVSALGSAAVRAQDFDAQAASAAPADTSLDALIAAMGDPDYEAREEAMRQIIAMGGAIAEPLEQRLATESDPEIRHRIRYILTAVLPPDQAVLVLNAWPGSGLQAGDVITHVDNRRIRRPAELQRFSDRSAVHRVRLNRAGVSQDLDHVNLASIVTIAEYRAPRGAQVAEMVRLYAQGFAEQAYERLLSLRDATPASELPPLLQVLIAHTAGHESEALGLLADDVGAALPTDPRTAPWRSPSEFDLMGPFKAPYRLELLLWERALTQSGDRNESRDRAVQRVLVPANRLVDAMIRAADMWFHELRDRLEGGQDNTTAGNMLAVTAWMFSDLDLLSECMSLIEPRSTVLGFTWVRVQLKAWTPYLLGDETAAVDAVFEDAREILRKYDDRYALIRDPQIAAQSAFFLYQNPRDPRIDEMLRVVTQDPTSPGYRVLPEYAWWMCFALNRENVELIRRDLPEIIPNIAAAEAARYAAGLIMLEYLSDKPNLETMELMVRPIETADDFPDRPAWAAACHAMRLLAQNKPADAVGLLAEHSESWIVPAILHTAKFQANPPGKAAESAPARGCKLALPIGSNSGKWLLLTADLRLAILDANSGDARLLDSPTPDWRPGPLTWPWFGRDESSGRVWVYDRRRVLEVSPEGDDALRMNISPRLIPAFAQHVGPLFDELANAVRETPLPPGERGEFLREDIQAHADYVADPDLPEVGIIRPVDNDPGFIHIGMRGGPSLIIETASGRSWSSHWIAEQLGLQQPPNFVVRAAPGQETPVLMLMSDQGLIRFDPSAGKVRRIAVPGAPPHPPVVPESTPYPRSDPRWVYFARTPDDETDPGRVYRVTLADDTVAEVDMINEALPPEHYLLRSRAQIRDHISQLLVDANIPPLQEFIADAGARVAEVYRERENEP